MTEFPLRRRWHHRARVTARNWTRRLDAGVASFMDRTGHGVERIMLGSLFVWFGTLKLVGEESATSIIAKTVYVGSPEVTVPALGVWEMAIGICLWFHTPL
ncbi:MAG: hypothetical protein AAF561_11860, partial [Planctomycetota bacterium]